MSGQKQGMSCPITGVNLKSLMILTIAGFIFIFAYNYALHAQFLKSTYDLTPQMWRTAEEMNSHFIFMLGMYLLTAYATADIYGRFAKEAGIGEGVRFGILLGLLLGSLLAAPYAWLPISSGLAQAWFLGGLLEGLGLGIVYSLIYKP